MLLFLHRIANCSGSTSDVTCHGDNLSPLRHLLPSSTTKLRTCLSLSVPLLLFLSNDDFLCFLSLHSTPCLHLALHILAVYPHSSPCSALRYILNCSVLYPLPAFPGPLTYHRAVCCLERWYVHIDLSLTAPVSHVSFILTACHPTIVGELRLSPWLSTCLS